MNELDFWHWWGIAAALGALDMLARRGDFLCAGVGALVVGLVLFFFPGLSWPGQLLVFAGVGLVVVLVSRRLARRGGRDGAEEGDRPFS